MNLHDKNFSEAEKVVNSLPSMQQIVQNQQLLSTLSPQAILFLDWLLNLGSVQLRKISVDEFDSKTKFSTFVRSPLANSPVKPTHIFEICQTTNTDVIGQQTNADPLRGNNDVSNLQNSVFGNLQQRVGSSIGYHGSSLENWHNILHGGLDVRFQKETSIFGIGIYLADDPNVAHSFKKAGLSWKKSMLGTRISCVAACEVLNHPEVLRGSEQSFVNGEGEKHLPKHYILVKNNHYVRIKYLLVYNDEIKQPASRFWITIFVYIAILLFVAMYKSPPSFKRSIVDKLMLL